MTCSMECTQFDLAMELLIEHGFEGIADQMNSAMQLERSRHLNAEPCERTVRRTGYANGYKNKTVSTRFGEVKLAIAQTRGAEFYSQSLECKKIRSRGQELQEMK